VPAAVLAAMTFVAGQGVLLAGRYRLDEPLASGGAGQVWRAVDLVLERPVAVKLLRPKAAAEPEAHARFRAEARNASRLSHPGVAQVYDYGDSSSAEVPFLVMELVDGPSLAAVLAAGPLDPGQTMDLIAQVGAGLHAAHAAGLVHRDIKPANLLITADGQVKITDFGIAHVVRGVPLTATGILVGTPAYLAPERAAGGPATPASDLYSLGVVGYECLTGVPPFRGPALEVAEAHLRCPFPGLPVTVPAEIGALVAALTAKNPGSRPASAREVAERAGQLRGAAKITSSRAISPVTAPGGSGAAPPLTLTDVSAPSAQASPPVSGGPPAGRRSASTWKKAGAGLAMVAALTVAGLAGWQAGLAGWQAGLAGAARPHGAAAPRQPSPPSAPMAVVSSASLVGQRAGVVLADLCRLGLRPHLAWVPTSSQPPGTVLSVQPGGTMAPETIVTVTVAAPPAQQDDQKPGGDGNGGGKDGGGGNDSGGRNGDNPS
jgi:serine/threonine-protein kinase